MSMLPWKINMEQKKKRKLKERAKIYWISKDYRELRVKPQRNAKVNSAGRKLLENSSLIQMR
jgi:hypothetical protein